MNTSIMSISDGAYNRLVFLAEAYYESAMNNGWSRDKGSYKKLPKNEIILVLFKGLELGLAPMQSLDMLYSVKGKVTLTGAGVMAVVNATKQLEDLQIIVTPQEASCTMKRKGVDTPHTAKFSIENAKALDIYKSQWLSQPENMLKWRAITACARVLFADAMQGLYTPDEIDPDNYSITEEGEVAILESPIPPVAQPSTPKLQAPVIHEYVAQEGDARVTLLQVQAERDAGGKPFLLCADVDGELFHCASTSLFRNAGYEVTKEWGDGQARTLTPPALATIRQGEVVNVVKNEG